MPTTAPNPARRGSKPKPPKILPRQIEPRYDRIQVDGLPVAAEGVVVIHADLAPCRWLDLLDHVQGFRILVFLVS